MKKIIAHCILLVSFFVTSCSTIKQTLPFIGSKPVQLPKDIKLHAIVPIPHGATFDSTTIGGLSGIDYDAKSKLFYIISDDRSEHNPARFYTMRISDLDKDTPSVNWISVHTLKNNQGNTYPSMQTFDSLRNAGKRVRFNVVDAEAIRYNPKGKVLYWANEGERILDTSHTILSDPTIQAMDLDGRWLYSFHTPKWAQADVLNQGIQRNRGFEALSLTPDGKYLFAGIEGTLNQDIPQDNHEPEAVRILKYDTEYRALKATYAYPVEKVVIDSIPYSYSIAELITITDSSMIIIERLYHKNHQYDNEVKLYLAEITPATTDIMHYKTLLHPKKKWLPMKKTLLLDMKSLPVPIDNIEGITFGPKIGDKQSLVLVSDNNFNEVQQTILYILTY